MNTFISKILSLFFCCFVLGNVFAQDEVKTLGFVINNTNDSVLDYSEFVITIIETGEVAMLDSIGRFQFLKPDNCTQIGLNIKIKDSNQNLYLDDLDNMMSLLVIVGEDGIVLRNHQWRIVPVCEKGEQIDLLPTYHPIQRRSFPTYTYFNKSMGM